VQHPVYLAHAYAIAATVSSNAQGTETLGHKMRAIAYNNFNFNVTFYDFN